MFTCCSKCYLFTYLAHVSEIFCWYILLLQYMETTNWSNWVDRHVLPFIISVFRALQLWLKHTIAYCEPTYHSLIKKKRIRTHFWCLGLMSTIQPNFDPYSLPDLEHSLFCNHIQVDLGVLVSTLERKHFIIHSHRSWCRCQELFFMFE